MKTVALYERVSTLAQAEEGYSIGEQESRLKLFAQAHRWIVSAIYSDPGFSGGKLDRPGIQRLIRDAKAHKFDAVLIYKLDRLSRSQKDTLYLIEDVFNPNGIGLISMNENFDTQTAFGQAMIGILSVFAQLERGQITERMTMGRIGRAKAGYYSGGSKPPIGYTYSRADGAEKNTLQIDQYEALQVREVFRLFLEEDKTFTEICRIMHDKYTNRYGSWSAVSTISRVLRDHTYIGEVSFGGKWYPGVHDPIIDKEKFEAVQKKYDRYINTTAGTFSQNFAGGHLLTGMVRCGLCGGRYFVKSWKRTLKDGTVRRYAYYACYTETGQNKKMAKKGKCENIKIPVSDLEIAVIGEVQKLALNTDLVREKSFPGGLEENEKDTAALQERLAELSRQEEKLIDLYQIGAIDIEAVRKRADALKAEREKVQEAIDSGQKVAAASMTSDEAIKKLADFETIFREGSPEEKHSFIRSLIDEIVIFPDRIEIHWAFEAK